MTLDEARQLLDAVRVGTSNPPWSRVRLALQMTESSIAMAIATERQACVKECEIVWMHTSGDAAKQCATAIRRRTKDELQEQERRDALGPWEDRA